MIPAGTIIQRQNEGGGAAGLEGHEKSEEPFGAASPCLLERITGEEAACARKENFFTDSSETPAESPDRK